MWRRTNRIDQGAPTRSIKRNLEYKKFDRDATWHNDPGNSILSDCATHSVQMQLCPAMKLDLTPILVDKEPGPRTGLLNNGSKRPFMSL
jgi:hypothetical protein